MKRKVIYLLSLLCMCALLFSSCYLPKDPVHYPADFGDGTYSAHLLGEEGIMLSTVPGQRLKLEGFYEYQGVAHRIYVELKGDWYEDEGMAYFYDDESDEMILEAGFTCTEKQLTLYQIIRYDTEYAVDFFTMYEAEPIVLEKYISTETESDTSDSELPESYAFVEEGENRDQLVAALDWDEIMAQIPSDEYVSYPGLHGKPLTATLHKDGEAVQLDVMDPRLVKLINFYNNMVYHNLHAYTQGSFDIVDMEKFEACQVRLELTYTPVWEESFDLTFDKMLIIGGGAHDFIGVRSNSPLDDDSGNYPYTAYGRYPLYGVDLDWMTMFGF